MTSKRSLETADKLEGFAEQRKQREPAFTAPGPGLPAKRSGLEAPAPSPQPNVYTSLTIAASHRAALRSVASKRVESGFANRHDISAVLRDVLDYWQAHPEEVNKWIEHTHRGSKPRR